MTDSEPRRPDGQARLPDGQARLPDGQAEQSRPQLVEAQQAPLEEIPALLHDAREDVLIALLDNPHLNELHLCLLLERKELSAILLEEIARRRIWLRSHQVRRCLASHPHTPRALAMRLVRELELMGLVRLCKEPTAPAELRRLAEEILIARLPRLPLGLKLTLARQGTARVAGGLLAEGNERVARVALDNGLLTEAQILRVLSREQLAAPVVALIAGHPKWSALQNVRVALVRHPRAPLARVAAFLPHLALRDLEDLCRMTTLPASVRQHLRAELARRTSGGLARRTAEGHRKGCA